MSIKDHLTIVDETKYRCADHAPAAGGVSAANPTDKPGTSETDATQVYWTFTLMESGFFRVCYKKFHATNGLWHQILSHSEIPHLNPHTTTCFNPNLLECGGAMQP